MQTTNGSRLSAGDVCTALCLTIIAILEPLPASAQGYADAQAMIRLSAHSSVPMVDESVWWERVGVAVATGTVAQALAVGTGYGFGALVLDQSCGADADYYDDDPDDDIGECLAGAGLGLLGGGVIYAAGSLLLLPAAIGTGAGGVGGQGDYWTTFLGSAAGNLALLALFGLGDELGSDTLTSFPVMAALSVLPVIGGVVGYEVSHARRAGASVASTSSFHPTLGLSGDHRGAIVGVAGRL
jgi:hypothetical protein